MLVIIARHPPPKQGIGWAGGVAVMERTRRVYQELNLCQMLDILREVRVARVAVCAQDQPYITPMYFQMQMEGAELILHLACEDRGLRLACLRQNPCVALEIERESCVGTDVVLALGEAELRPAEDGMRLRVMVEELSGRCVFLE